MTFRQYLDTSRQQSVSLTFVLPLLILYEAGILLLESRVENLIGVAFFKGPLWRFFGARGTLIFNALVVVAFLAAYARAERRGKLSPELFLGMLAESLVYAVFFGAVVSQMLRFVPGLAAGAPAAGVDPGLRAPLLAVLLSMGAGVYEEVFFRALLLSGLLWLLRRHVGLEWGWAALVAVVVSSTLFSAFHHVGPLADPFTARRFAFRYLAGVLLAILYLGRGLGIAVYTHCLYDILIVLRAFHG